MEDPHPRGQRESEAPVSQLERRIQAAMLAGGSRWRDVGRVGPFTAAPTGHTPTTCRRHVEGRSFARWLSLGGRAPDGARPSTRPFAPATASA